MIESAPIPQTFAASAKVDALHPSRVGAERRLRHLEEVSDYSMDLMRQMRAAGGELKAQAEALASIGRTIRDALAMEAKADEELRGLPGGPDDEERWEPAPLRPTKTYVERFRTGGLAAIDRMAESEEEFESLCKRFEERLQLEGAFRGWDRDPMSLLLWGELAGLGVFPGFDRWDDKAQRWKDGPLIRRRYADPEASLPRLSAAAPAPAPAATPASVPAHVMVAPEGMKETFEPGFKEALLDRVFQAIDALAASEEEFARLNRELDACLARDDPWMYGGYSPLRGAVGRLATALRLDPDWKLWQGETENWIQDPPIPRRRDTQPPPDRE